ncbi:hypothetical protein [Thioalkalivibrio sp. ALJ9]|uniref:hypothetical protein n=1 Tax=Thioalkalivibrio sp. ALJ9 TaxID=1158758 RepID=UPI0012DDD8DD|nr:hypothetical protein [Thioalkalivibrio sp. ALJ9]
MDLPLLRGRNAPGAHGRVVTLRFILASPTGSASSGPTMSRMGRIVVELAQNIGSQPLAGNAAIRNLRGWSQLRRIDLTFPGTGVAGPFRPMLESIAFTP